MTEPAAAQAAPPVAPVAPAAAPPAPAVVAPPTPAAQAAAPQPGSDPEVAKLQAELATWKEQARKHEDRWKARDNEKAESDAKLKLIAEKIGLSLDGQPDPAKLAEQLSAVQQQANQRAIELAVYRAAATAGANADLLLDSRAFMAKASGLDPAAADFTERVKEFAADAVKSNPTLAVTPPPTGQQDGQQGQPVAQPPAAPLPASSGADFSGAPGGQRPWTEEDVDRASPEALTKAINDGLLAHMGVGRSRHTR